ncbi:hypothetical protein BZA70DRAFT_64221 [Myxozyma melibiosi]|uniref:Arylesterase n=1 Tax=Myxozyma melibiosi TaxID=54550 RepID=A0ABR1F274_9ASCO
MAPPGMYIVYGIGIFLAFLSKEFFPHPATWLPVALPPQDRYTSSSLAVNNDNCKLIYGAEGCEDVAVDKLTGEVYMGCGSVEGRMSFFPPQNHHKVRPKFKQMPMQDSVVLFDPQTEQLKTLELRGYHDREDFILHGMNVFYPPDKPDTRIIFFVNHQRGSSIISVFKYTTGTDYLEFLHDIRSPYIVTPNAVVAVSETSFYITNDHKYRKGTWRAIEDTMGPFLWANIVFCEFSYSTNHPKCSIKNKNYFSYANGILLVDGGKKLVVTDTRLAKLSVFSVDPLTHNLDLELAVSVHASMDNISELPSGDILVAAFPNGASIWPKIEAPFNEDVVSESMALLFKKNESFAIPHVVFWDDGHQMSVMTSASYDVKSGKLIGGGVCAPGVFVCNLDKSVFGL